MVALETWVNLAEKVLEKAEKTLENMQKNGLDKWLNRELTYQVTPQDGTIHHLQENKSQKQK